ncbi:protein kinase domain-containing protein [Bacillus sp. FJAT-27245]|uniref:protein kinase domain-containing protein n=1 Tax=Bacillus sp. FJAT-27245 TaxID=1684144 RepID=UPI0006A76327|nr:serine/threonine-protein kinase [Bacillus sp. FJAT-27245]
MMNPSSKNPCRIGTGTVISGKWHRNEYLVLKELGNGANGVVYLVKSGNEEAALKISGNSMSITSEVNVLKSFAKARGQALGPLLLDMDDWIAPDGMFSFYVMEYIKGPGLQQFVFQKGKEWMHVLLLQLLTDLDLFHKNGWVFGDLKPENLIVTGPPPRIRCIDVGGTTLIGRAIKEYTEFYDRGYWGLGTRKAEPSYDLFAVAMVMIASAYQGTFRKAEGGMGQLLGAIRKKEELTRFEPVLSNALLGKYGSARGMREALLRTASPLQPKIGAAPTVRPTAPPAAGQSLRRHPPGKTKKRSNKKETFFVISVLALLYFVYIVVQLT